jgi:predicted transcriptional regulator
MSRRPLRLFRGGVPGDLESVFGRLELLALDALWRRTDPASVRDLQPDFPNTAYTTLMTTLDRLHRKGVLDRIKSGRAFLYRPRYSRDALRSGLATEALGAILGGDADALRPVLSYFVDAVTRRDADALATLEQLVRARERADRES